MKKFIIPKKINIMGRNISIIFSQDGFHNDDAIGTTSYRDDTITIAKYNGKQKKRTQQQQELIFLHELIHWILFLATGGVEELHRNEGLVERMAGILREALLQIKFEE
jgi:hypothetical protein